MVMPFTMYRCSICGNAHNSKENAEACENQGLMLPRWKIGDVVEFIIRRDFGYCNKKGVVVNILFLYDQYSSSYPGHEYQVVYEVRETIEINPDKFGRTSRVEFFDVEESNTYYNFCNGKQLLSSIKDWSKDLRGMSKATSWKDYCEKILSWGSSQGNDSIIKRLADITLKMKEKGALLE